MRGTLGWLRPGKVAFGSAVAGPCCGAAPGLARERIFILQLGRLVLCVHHAQLRSRPTPQGFSTGGQVSPFKNSGSSTSSSPAPLTPFPLPASPPGSPEFPLLLPRAKAGGGSGGGTVFLPPRGPSGSQLQPWMAPPGIRGPDHP